MGQPEITADAMDVGIDGNHQLGWRNRPETEVDTVGRANHPSRVEDEALARTSGARIADEVTQTATGRIPAKRIGEAGQAFAEVPIAGLVKACEGVSEAVVRT